MGEGSNQTVDDLSLSWDTDDIAIPDSWNEGEETADEVYRTAQEESNTEGDEDNESEDSLPELVSNKVDTSEDAFLNTPPSAEDEDFEAAPETKEEKEKEEEEKKENMYKVMMLFFLNRAQLIKYKNY